MIFAFSLLLLMASADAKKKSSKKHAKNHKSRELVSENKKDPLRCIAREIESGRALTHKDQATFLEHDLEETSDQVGMIRYTITFFKEKDRYSMDVWDDATRCAVNKFRDVHAQDGDWVDDIVADIRELLVKAFDADAPRSGIHAEVKVQMSSGEKPRDCKCGDACTCAVKYAGNCPCSLESPKSYPAEIRVSCLDRKK